MVLERSAGSEHLGTAATGKQRLLFQLKPGLWEFSVIPRVSGDTIMPQSMLARIPAAQRAQSMLEFRKSISEATRERECISQAKFESRLFSPEGGCTTKVNTNSPNRLAVQTECRAESGDTKQYTVRKVLASDPADVITAFHAITSQGNKAMTIDSVSRGHWIGANCGNLQGIPEYPSEASA